MNNNFTTLLHSHPELELEYEHGVSETNHRIVDEADVQTCLAELKYLRDEVEKFRNSQESTQLKDAICTKCNGVGWYAVQVGVDTQEQCQCEYCGGTGKLQLKDLLNEGLVILGKLDGFKGRNRLVEIFDKVIAKLESIK